MPSPTGFRAPEAVERLVHGRPRARRAKQLHLGPNFVRRPPTCVGCAHKLPKDATGCDRCGAFICTNCDEPTSVNGGDGERCYECLVHGKPAPDAAE